MDGLIILSVMVYIVELDAFSPCAFGVGCEVAEFIYCVPHTIFLSLHKKIYLPLVDIVQFLIYILKLFISSPQNELNKPRMKNKLQNFSLPT